ncbi:MAG: hypothetical protein P4L90_11445 [Rhodopila sp.]|nr:hypothetical protein [Rhodopila sp.]
MANNPHVILAAEPTTELDSKRAGVVMILLRSVAAEREIAVLVVTPDEENFGQFDRVIRLRDGFLEENAPATAGA